MRISVDTCALRATQWHQYAIRFALGGLATAGAGLIAKQFGPAIGGLFLAFPAIFPATVTLIAKRERCKKESHGLQGSARGRKVAALDAAGAVLGAIALISFASLVWKELPSRSAPLVLVGASVVWLLGSTVLWWLRKKHLWPTALSPSAAKP